MEEKKTYEVLKAFKFNGKEDEEAVGSSIELTEEEAHLLVESGDVKLKEEKEEEKEEGGDEDSSES